jgi:hypothetical protein
VQAVPQQETSWAADPVIAGQPLADRLPEPGKRVSDLEPDELLYTDDPAADRQAVRPVAD